VRDSPNSRKETAYDGALDIFQFDFDLPAERIAQEPVHERDRSRLLVLDRSRALLAHRRFDALPEVLEAGDLLVLNDTRVVPVRIAGRRRSGARLDMIVVREVAPRVWTALIQGARRVKSGEVVLVGAARMPVELRRRGDPDEPWEIRFGAGVDVKTFFEAEGRAPVPPYIHRDPVSDPRDDLDRERYQTVYAARPGAIAAPTAGLHFTPELLKALEARGVHRTTVTLHVGAGTFLPVKTERIDDHRMHAERFEVNRDAVAAIEAAQERGGRVIPVGTTSLRALEAAADETGRITPVAASTELFIRPGYAFRVADGLVTNFHLPRSTLLMLVAALAGLDRIKEAYAEAVREGYRFYSYGDAMLIL